MQWQIEGAYKCELEVCKNFFYDTIASDDCNEDLFYPLFSDDIQTGELNKSYSLIKKHTSVQNQENSRKFECRICNSNFLTNKDLNNHACPNQQHNYKCDLCEYKSISVENKEVHKKDSHAQVLKYRCDWCEYES